MVIACRICVNSAKMSDLVQRDGLYYKKFTDVPFTGEVEGKDQGSFKDERRDGPWVDYDKDGNLLKRLIGTYKNS